MKRIIFILFIICLFASSGCESLNRNRRLKYIDEHPELTQDQQALMLNGRLWVGMTEDEVEASLGEPYIKQEDLLGKETVWSYMWHSQLTTHHKYKFERVLRLQFLEGLLANWRED